MDDRYRKAAGVNGENAALRYLCSRGLELVARNYRCRAGEIDLVMLEPASSAPAGPASCSRGHVGIEPPTLALVEVRYRSLTDFGGAAASVYWRKQRRIVRAARHLLLCRPDLRVYRARFDVVALSPAPSSASRAAVGSTDGPVVAGLRIEWLRHAFTA